MRFQSSGAFSRLAPNLIADAYGPCQVLSVTALSGQTVPFLPAPPAGNYYQIFAASIRATTTVTSTGNLTISDTSGNNVLTGFYETPGGEFNNWSGYLPYGGQLSLRNSTAVTGTGTIWFRTVPIPT